MMLQMLRAEGVSSFYSGIVPRLGRVIPGQGKVEEGRKEIMDEYEVEIADS